MGVDKGNHLFAPGSSPRWRREARTKTSNGRTVEAIRIVRPLGGGCAPHVVIPFSNHFRCQIVRIVFKLNTRRDEIVRPPGGGVYQTLRFLSATRNPT